MQTKVQYEDSNINHVRTSAQILHVRHTKGLATHRWCTCWAEMTLRATHSSDTVTRRDRTATDADSANISNKLHTTMTDIMTLSDLWLGGNVSHKQRVQLHYDGLVIPQLRSAHTPSLTSHTYCTVSDNITSTMHNTCVSNTDANSQHTTAQFNLQPKTSVTST